MPCSRTEVAGPGETTGKELLSEAVVREREVGNNVTLHTRMLNESAVKHVLGTSCSWGVCPGRAAPSSTPPPAAAGEGDIVRRGGDASCVLDPCL